jgi:AcrR family transcriptional regulator
MSAKAAKKVRHQPGEPSNPAIGRIVTAAREHFFAHGFRNVTMDDLAAALGMSKKTLYAVFPSKTALLRAVLLDKIGSVERDLDAIMTRSSGDALAALQQLLACMQRHSGEIQPPFVRDMRSESPELFQLVEVRRRAIIQRYFGSIFAAGRRSGSIRRDVSTDLIVEILLSAVQAIMNPANMEQFGLTPKTGYSAITSVILNGVIAKKGSSK